MPFIRSERVSGSGLSRSTSGLPFRDYAGQITVEPQAAGARISTEISFRTIVPGSQFFVAIAIRVTSARAARAANRRAC